MPPARSRPSGTPARQNRTPTALPSYQSTSHPLNAQAQSALHDLPCNHKLNTLKDRLKAANNHLTQAAADINDRFQERNTTYENVRRRRQEKGSQSDGEEGAELETMREDTDKMTQALEAKVRKVIDASAEVEGVEKALKELDANVTAGRGVVSDTQGESQVRSQRRQRRVTNGEDEDEFDDEEGDGAVTALKSKIATHRHEYQSESLAARYTYPSPSSSIYKDPLLIHTPATPNTTTISASRKSSTTPDTQAKTPRPCPTPPPGSHKRTTQTDPRTAKTTPCKSPRSASASNVPSRYCQCKTPSQARNARIVSSARQS